MKVKVPIPEPREYRIPGPKRVEEVVREVGLNPESVIVIRGESLLPRDALLEDEAEIEIRPAISGGDRGLSSRRLEPKEQGR